MYIKKELKNPKQMVMSWGDGKKDWYVLCMKHKDLKLIVKLIQSLKDN